MSIYLFSSLARIWSPEYEDSSGQLGAGEDVEEAEAEKGHDVFDVVLVGAAQPLNVLLHAGLEAGIGSD